MKELFRAEIPHYLTHVKVANTRPFRYYTQLRSIPLKYRNDNYTFNNYGVLIDRRTYEAVVANPKTAGKPKFKKINGKELNAGRLNPYIRSLIIREMRNFYGKRLSNQKTRVVRECKLNLTIHHANEESTLDLKNMSLILVKIIQGLLFDLNILPKDDKRLLRGFEVLFEPVEKAEERTLVV